MAKICNFVGASIILKTSKTEVLQMPSAIEVYKENLELRKESNIFLKIKKKRNFSKKKFNFSKR